MILTDTLQDTVLKLLVDTKIKSGVIIQHITQNDTINHCRQILDGKQVIHMHIKDELLFNAYGIIVVNPKKFPHVEYEKAMIFINWLLSDEGKSTINGFKLNGYQLFFTY